MSANRENLFEEVCSKDFLSFSFGGRSYQDQLYDSIAKTKALAGVKVQIAELPGVKPGSTIKVVWVSHLFGFLGGSLGCAEGERITRAFEYAAEHKMPVCVQCRSGGARMQEGTSSLMQMAKVSVAVEKLRREGLPFISVLNDPTYGGVSASYAMQADVRIAISDARVGFAGPAVILNTMCEQNQAKFDLECPADFQSAQFVLEHGQIDLIIPSSVEEGKEGAGVDVQSRVESTVASIASLLTAAVGNNSVATAAAAASAITYFPPTEADMAAPFNYTKSRHMDRPQCQDLISNLFGSYVELQGDGKVGLDVCMQGGLATFDGRACVVLGTFKGHTPGAMQDANYGMASPNGYRTALRLMKLAERFNLPVVTLVDTVGAWPTFQCEADGQSEAIATNLTAMAALRVPIITVMVGEGGSGGALGIGMGNCIGMCSGGYFGVISPEGAASILGRYKDDAHKAIQLPLDCQELATAQCIYANQLKDIGVVDEIIWEKCETDPESKETFRNFPVLRSRVHHFITTSLDKLCAMTPDQLIAHRYDKFRKMGTFSILDDAARSSAIALAEAKKGPNKRPLKEDRSPSLLIKHLAEEVVCGASSKYRKLAPPSCPEVPPSTPALSSLPRPEGWTNAKKVLDAKGPDGLVAWVREQKRVLITDTTMRDAHQSLMATRARTEDLVKGAAIANELLKDAFSFESWGGATFDVCMRFLDECPWERLREIRAACPDVCLQMLIRGANAVGYTSYPDNVVTEFCRLAALNGMDIFRIFDCFNDIENMRVAINAVRATGTAVAEVALCYTGNVLTSSIYNVDYYRDLAKKVTEAGAHMIAIKDMAGLLKPLEVKPLLDAIRSVTDLPIHFHTHATSSGSIATCMEMARCNCDIIDFATASMADGTSQPSMNAFVAMMEGAPNDTGINYLELEPYDMYWARVRDMYSPFESGMKSGSARVFEHQIPGGQYSNLIVQCQSMGLWDRWEEVLDAYRDVNRVLGDIVKVTPSSKCVGDLALYLITRDLVASDLLDPVKAANIDFPDSVEGLMLGDLGFPHKGFPPVIEQAILKGRSRRTVRAGLTLPPADFADNIAKLSETYGRPISAEQAMSSLMYPKVFSDYMKRVTSKGGLLRFLPTPVYFYAMTPGQKFNMTVPAHLAQDVLKTAVGGGSGDAAAGFVQVSIQLQRVSPLKDGYRNVIFLVNGVEQHANVKDSTGKFVFSGPMATAGKAEDIASPMPGLVDKLLVGEKSVVAAGDVLCIISAMKMEVKVTAPTAGTITNLHVAVGTRVIEGALLMNMTPSA